MDWIGEVRSDTMIMTGSTSERFPRLELEERLSKLEEKLTVRNTERFSRLEREERLSRLEDLLMRLQERDSRLKLQSEQLLPGIPDDITLAWITTKLPWNEFHVLTSLNRSWHNAVRNHHVYEARVQSRSTDTFITYEYWTDPETRIGLYGLRDNDFLECPPNPKTRIGLYGLRDKDFLDCPPIPGLLGGILQSSRFIPLDGKLYVLGGQDNHYYPSDKVWVLDLAGRREWIQCASMQKRRVYFQCGVLGGKIYVFGGTDVSYKIRQGEVYDLQKNTWSPIKSMLSSGDDFKVTVIGEEIVIYDGSTEDNLLEIYDPRKDEWRVGEPFLLRREHTILLEGGTTFTAQGKFYYMDRVGIYVYNFDGSSWTRLHSNSFNAIELDDSLDFDVDTVVVVDDELFATVFMSRKQCLLRGRGFGSEETDIAWVEEIECIRDDNKWFSCAIHL